MNSITTISGTNITTPPIDIRRDEAIKGLNYINDCKIKFPYINEYNNPPFWVVIKTLMLNDLIVLLYGLKKRTFDAVLRDFNLKPNDKEKFLNSIEIIKELRNNCAHFELVNRFKTPQNLKINNHLITELGLRPERSQFVIKLYDVLKVLKMYVDLTEVKSFFLDFWIQEVRYGNSQIAVSLLDSMGNSNINDWV
nr:Abi family protein [Mesobacillus selenatarsenatis]